MNYEVRDGLWPVKFDGTELAVSTTERDMPEGSSWLTLEQWQKRAVGRWVRMVLYKVPPQPDPTGRIALPDGGYFFHIVGESLIYHTRGSACNAGVPVLAKDTPIDVLPCWNCRPAPPMLWEETPADDPALLVDPGFPVDLESPRHTLRRAHTAEDIVRKVIDKQMSTPAQRLLEMAMEKDPDIAQVFNQPAA